MGIDKMDNERDREIGMVIKKVNKYVLNPRGMCSFNYGIGEDEDTYIIGMRLPLLIQETIKRMENERREKLKTNIR